MRPATHNDHGRSGLTTARAGGAASPSSRSDAAHRRASEETIHRAVVDALARAAKPGIAWTHMPAGEARAKGVAGKLKGMGVKPGWPDLLIVKGGRLYGLELKTETGRVSPAQVAAHEALRAAGAEVAIAFGLDAALEQLARWGVLRVAPTARGERDATRSHDPPG